MTILPGQTLWLRGGTYSGDYIATLAGSNPDYLTIRAYPGEKPVVDGSMNIQGGWLTFIEIEFMNSRTDRVRSQTGGNLDTVTGTTGAANLRLINCFIHDSEENGVGLWKQATNSLLYGCVIYNNGFVNTADDAGDGHGVYTQNTSGTKTFRQNVFSSPFHMCFQAYARDDTPQLGWDFRENVVVGGRVYFGGDASVRQEGVSVDANHLYNASVQLGDLYPQNGDLIFTNNRLHGGVAGLSGQPLTLKYWENINLQNNRLVSAHNKLLRFIEPADTSGNVRAWDGNEYYGPGLDATPFNEDGVENYSLADWRTAKGFDGNSTLTATLPTTNEIFVYPNEYRDIHSCRMGIIVVWNWEGLSSVGVDLSSLELANGNYCLRNGVNISETYSFAYAGSALSIPMDGWTVSSPIGMDAPLIDNPFPLFGCFVLERAL